MNVAAVRADLERTGGLFTQNEGDVGHISDFWRSTILDLCDALDAAPMDVADLLRRERNDHQITLDELDSARSEIEEARFAVEQAERDKSDAEDALAAASQLISEAAPRMRTLNNAMSPGWLARAAALLGE